MTIFGAILGIVIIISLISWIIGYNALIKYLNWVEEAWSQIDIQLTRRMELIPPLVETAQQHAKFEQHTLEKIVELRGQIISPHNSRLDLMKLNQELTEHLQHVFNLKNEVTELNQNERFSSLETDLKESETKIKKAVVMYNNTVSKYNAKIQSPPTSFVANIHNFRTRKTLNYHTQSNDKVKIS